MAVVSITADNTRVEDAESGTGWANIGGGAGGAAEGSFPYQGSNLYNRKVTGTAGFYYDPTGDAGSAQDMTTAALRTMMVKAIVTDYAGLNATSGLRVRIGSGTTAYYVYNIAGSGAKINSLAAYPARGGLIIIPIDPNIAAYRDSTTGSPALTAVDYFGLEANFDSSTAKSENVGLDAIDLGRGLILVGGDGADADGVWQDFVDADEGTTSNRWGFASSTLDAVKLFFGTMRIGGPAATVFNDVDSQILWLDGLFAAGWSRAIIDIGNSGSTITDGATHTGLGSATTEDTRPDYIVYGTEGAHTFNGILNNFRVVNLSPASTVPGATIEAETFKHGYADIDDTTIITQEAANAATVKDVVKTEENPVTVASNNQILRLDNNHGRGQAFTANVSGVLRKAAFNIYKVGSPTGNAKARLYNITGTVGTNAQPTGTALAVSNTTLDISTLGVGNDNQALVEFEFTDGYSMTAGNDYAIVFELETGGSSDASNYVAIICDNTNLTHSGNGVVKTGASTFGTTAIFTTFVVEQATTFANMANVTFKQGNAGHAIEITEPGSYDFSGFFFDGYGGTPGTNSTPSSGATDAAVYNNSGGAVTINVTGGGDSPSVRNAASSTTTINNNTQVTLTGLPIGVEVRVYNDTGSPGSPVAGTEINGIETTVSSTFSFTAPATSDVIIVIFDEDQIRDGGVYQQYQVPNNDTNLPFSLLSDRVFLNP